MGMILEKPALDMPNGSLSNTTPLVAVFMVTYNHEAYIKTAIESVLSQKTTFEWQLFIGEDGSKDSTPTLCKRYADEFPEKVKLFSRGKNIGVFENANLLFQSCLASGAKYIAMLEGDDCWISEEKLEQQVAYLEQHDDCAGSFHNTDFLYANGERKAMFKQIPEKMHWNDVIGKYSPFHTTSFIFRSKHFCRPAWFRFIHSVDMAMYIWHAQFGYFKGFDATWSLYRIHHSGMTATKEHNELFHRKRGLLYQLINGKLSIPFSEKIMNLMDYHQSQVNKDYLDCPDKLLFFNATENWEEQLLKMELDAEILPFQIKGRVWEGYFKKVRLFSFKWLNAQMIKYVYKKHWEKIDGVIFSSVKDAKRFEDLFPKFDFSYVILEKNKDQAVRDVSVIIDNQWISAEDTAKKLADCIHAHLNHQRLKGLNS